MKAAAHAPLKCSRQQPIRYEQVLCEESKGSRCPPFMTMNSGTAPSSALQ